MVSLKPAAGQLEGSVLAVSTRTRNVVAICADPSPAHVYGLTTAWPLEVILVLIVTESVPSSRDSAMRAGLCADRHFLAHFRAAKIVGAASCRHSANVSASGAAITAAPYGTFGVRTD